MMKHYFASGTIEVLIPVGLFAALSSFQAGTGNILYPRCRDVHGGRCNQANGNGKKQNEGEV